MKKKHDREVIYSQQSTDFVPGKIYSNPRHFSTPRLDATKVFLVGDWPAVQEAYEALGVPVEHLDEAAARRSLMGLPAEVVRGDAPKALTPTAPASERDGIEIPADWQALPWTAKGEAPSLRSLASKLSATPVLNKAQAEAAITAELERRAEVVSDDGEGSIDDGETGEGEGSDAGAAEEETGATA